MQSDAIPTLVMFAGLPGTGKSTIATALARRIGWPILDKDLLNDVLLHADLPQSQAAPLAYQQVLALAENMVVEQRLSVILVSAGRQPFILDRCEGIVRAAGGRLKVIRCVVPFETRQARLRARRSGPSQWTQDETTPEQEAEWYAHLPPDTLIVESTRSADELLAQVVPFLQV